MTELPGRLVLVGHPVSHSLSPRFQNAALRAAGIALTYEALDIAPRDLPQAAHTLCASSAAGNVTVPHKEAFARLCTTLSPVAERTGAVNTFWTEGGGLVGDNTDVGGFDAAVRATVGLPDGPFEVAVLGAGGAASAVLAAVERWEGARARVWSRTMSRAEDLAHRYARIARADWDLAEAVRGAGLVVNATPVGLDAGAVPVDPALLAPDAAAFDLAYRRGETDWVHACRARGLRASDGLPMLLEQGALAFERWFGRAPDRRAMRAAVS
ncbi:MAG TPA: shikimate dehydrogenase [Gemmatimonadaceae bacterium]|nr:shikimate dehydrogenase [Gemmatimonadaceae bacterium]